MTKMDQWVFIVNPVAGNGYAKETVPIIREQISKQGLEAEFVFTERVGHATELSASFADQGFNYIIAVGGDGTINEVAQPLIGNDQVVLGLIPAGTGNDFNQVLGFPDRFGETEWEQFFKLETRSMDIGTCNGMTFLNGMGLGFDAQVAAENYTEDGEVKKGGKNKYIWQILKTLLFYREKRMKVVTGSLTTETNCFMNTVSIGRRFAAAFHLTPKAIADDGLLDVCSIKRLGLLQRLKILTMVPKGTHIEDKRVNYFQTDHLDIEFPQKMPFHVDGELHFAQTFTIRIQPAALNIIYNQGGDHYFSK